MNWYPNPSQLLSLNYTNLTLQNHIAQRGLSLPFQLNQFQGEFYCNQRNREVIRAKTVQINDEPMMSHYGSRRAYQAHVRFENNCDKLLRLMEPALIEAPFQTLA